MRELTDAEKLQWRRDHDSGCGAWGGQVYMSCFATVVWLSIAAIAGWPSGTVGVLLFCVGLTGFFAVLNLRSIARQDRRPLGEDELNRVRARLINRGEL
jgi:hypothetical protein